MEVLPQMTCPRNWTADYLFGSDIPFRPVFEALFKYASDHEKRYRLLKPFCLEFNE